METGRYRNANNMGVQIGETFSSEQRNITELKSNVGSQLPVNIESNASNLNIQGSSEPTNLDDLEIAVRTVHAKGIIEDLLKDNELSSETLEKLQVVYRDLEGVLNVFRELLGS